jgi:hypothetical protein
MPWQHLARLEVDQEDLKKTRLHNSIPHLFQLEMLETKEALETVETDRGLESRIKVIKIRGRPKKNVILLNIESENRYK